MPPLSPLQSPTPPTTRLHRQRLLLCVGGLAGLATVGYIALAQYTDHLAAAHLRQAMDAPTLDISAAKGKLAPASSALKIPASYDQIIFTPSAPLPAAQPTRAEVPANPFAPAQPPPQAQAPGLPLPRALPPPPNTPRATPGAPPPPPAPKPAPWLFAKVERVAPDPDTLHEAVAESPREKAAHALFPKASWARPEDPTRVLYPSQIVNGVITHAVNSDEPGLIRILVTEEITDKFGQGVVLLPQGTQLLGTQASATEYGQERLGISLKLAELPDGTLIDVSKAKLGDDGGASGVSGSVNNHYGKLFLGVGLSALLNIGARNVGGNSGSFQPTVQQDLARDVGSGVNSAGQRIIQRELQVRPTITIEAGTSVTLQLLEPLNLQTAPAVVRQ